MTAAQSAKLREEFIRSQQKILGNKITLLERKLFDAVLKQLIKKLEFTPDGKIKSDGKNVELASVLDKIFRGIQNNELLDVVKSFSKDFQGIKAFNKEYFAIIANDKKKIDAIAKEVDATLKKRLGISAKGVIVKRGYLDKLVKDNTVLKQIKTVTNKAITSGKSLSEYKAQMKIIIVGNSKVNGAMIRHFNQFASDTYNQFDSTTQKLFAKKLGLNAFIYAGGIIDTSRCFCEERNGETFTADEAKEWESLIGGDCGPIWEEDTYDPVVDRGGYNCRHSINWISDSEAIRRRPELKGRV